MLRQLRRRQLGQFLLGDLRLLLGCVTGTRKGSVGRVLIPSSRLTLMTSWGTDTCLFSKYVNDIPVGNADIGPSRAFKHAVGEVTEAYVKRNHRH
jgi:hypothetical protein